MSQMLFGTASWNLMNWHIFKLILQVQHIQFVIPLWRSHKTSVLVASAPKEKTMGAWELSCNIYIYKYYIFSITWHLFISRTPYILDNKASRAATHWLVVHFERPVMFATNTIKQQACEQRNFSMLEPKVDQRLWEWQMVGPSESLVGRLPCPRPAARYSNLFCAVQSVILSWSTERIC